MFAAWRNGLSPMRLVLVGIGAGAFFYAGMQFLLTRSDIFEASAAQAWLTGSLNARVWLHVQISAFGALILVPLGLSLHASLERLEMGDDLAAASARASSSPALAPASSPSCSRRWPW